MSKATSKPRFGSHQWVEEALFGPKDTGEDPQKLKCFAVDNATGRFSLINFIKPDTITAVRQGSPYITMVSASPEGEKAPPLVFIITDRPHTEKETAKCLAWAVGAFGKKPESHSTLVLDSEQEQMLRFGHKFLGRNFVPRGFTPEIWCRLDTVYWINVSSVDEALRLVRETFTGCRILQEE